MKYEIKSYQEEFLDDQVRIGSSIFNRWRYGGQTPKEQLQEAYAKPDFDPETRLYALYKDKIVGFITTSVFEEQGVKKALFEFPFVEEGHENAEKILIERAIEVLKNKGAKILRTRAGEYWGNRKQLAEKYGFNHTMDLLRGSEKLIDGIASSKLEDPTNVQTFDYERDSKKLAQLAMNLYNLPLDNAKAVVATYKNWVIGEVILNPAEQKLVSHRIIVEGKEIVGRAVAFQSEIFGQKSVVLANIYIKDNNKKIKAQLLSAVIQDSKKMGYESLIVHTGPWGALPKDEDFTVYGFEFSSKIAYYEKEI